MIQQTLLPAAVPAPITFVVFGVAQPAGSKKAFVPKDKRTGKPFEKNGRIIVNVTDDNPKSKDWKQQVAYAARMAYRGQLLTGPLRLTLTFFRPRPKGHFTSKGALTKAATETPWPTTKPDVLKLARGVEDALTSVIWQDDAQIVDERLVKTWGEPARIEVRVDVIGNS